MDRGRLGFTVVLLLATLVGGLCFADGLVRKLPKVDALLGVVVLIPLLKRDVESPHREASFAHPADLKKRSNGGKPCKACSLVATAMGRRDVWAKRIAISASDGVRDGCIVQSRAQLRSVCGDNDAQNFITHHGCQVAFAPREQSDANEYSEMPSYKTMRRRQESRGANQTSTNYTEERLALYPPQEIKELPQGDELIFLEGCKPIKTSKNGFFKDKRFKKLTELAPASTQPAMEFEKGMRRQNVQEAKWLQ